jgi:maltooligosyltrehalose trehalohydrolase
LERSPVKWHPSLGAVVQEQGTTFEVWAPKARTIELILEKKSNSITHELQFSEEGKWRCFVPDITDGEPYRYRINGDRVLPDPASRFQPHGVHGPSQVINPHVFDWSDQKWRGIGIREAILYELHVGTFSEEGTFAGVKRRLPYLADLGVTAIELMPLGDFPGNRNWGYDGVALFAPARCYGTPEDLRQLVNSAHALGIAVLIDVVYNHFGPDGAYAPSFSPFYFTSQHKTFWGDAVNLDGPYSPEVRAFFIENALYWLHEFHVDGLRLDATHSMIDESQKHFVRELVARLRSTIQHREILLIAEDHRNLAYTVKPEAEDGWGLDAVWSDDFHHEVRRLLAGDSQGYFCDYRGSVLDLSKTIQNGWIFTGQYSEYYKVPRGTDSKGIDPEQFVFFLQNHDQVGNRAKGERLHHQIEDASYRAASTLLLCAPETPLLFMGQEWGASTPFCYFTDHHEELGRLIRAGRLNEFRHFPTFSEMPDPQSAETFFKSKLNWPELASEQHTCLLRLYRSLIEIRKKERAMHDPASHQISPIHENALLLRLQNDSSTIFVAVQLKDAGVIPLPVNFEVMLSTEDPQFCMDPQPIRMDVEKLTFARPGAIVIKQGSAGLWPA